jgi:hypothetical protein
MIETGTLHRECAVSQSPQGVLIESPPSLFVPESDLAMCDKIGAAIEAEDQASREAGKVACLNCGEWFLPRKGSGGKPQRFCKPECRAEHHTSKPNVPNEGQRGASESRELVPVVIPDDDAPADGPEGFDWFKDASVIVPEQQAVAVYRNQQGDIVIRQERSWSQDDDSFVVIHPDNLMRVIDRLCDLAGIGSAGK